MCVRATLLIAVIALASANVAGQRARVIHQGIGEPYLAAAGHTSVLVAEDGRVTLVAKDGKLSTLDSGIARPTLVATSPYYAVVAGDHEAMAIDYEFPDRRVRYESLRGAKFTAIAIWERVAWFGFDNGDVARAMLFRQGLALIKNRIGDAAKSAITRLDASALRVVITRQDSSDLEIVSPRSAKLINSPHQDVISAVDVGPMARLAAVINVPVRAL